MESVAADLAQRLAERAEAVCHHYLPNGVRRGSYWIVGDVSGAKGRSLYVRLRASSNTAAGKFVDYVALLVMLRRLRLSAFPQTVALLVRNIIFFAARCKRGCASINTEAQLCLKKFSFHEPLRDIDQRHL